MFSASNSSVSLYDGPYPVGVGSVLYLIDLMSYVNETRAGTIGHQGHNTNEPSCNNKFPMAINKMTPLAVTTCIQSPMLEEACSIDLQLDQNRNQRAAVRNTV